MSVPTFYVCPHLLCFSPPISFFADKPFLNLECGTSSPACFMTKYEDNHKNKDKLKNPNNLKNKDESRNADDLKNEDIL